MWWVKEVCYYKLSYILLDLYIMECILSNLMIYFWEMVGM